MNEDCRYDVYLPLVRKSGDWKSQQQRREVGLRRLADQPT